MGNQTGKRCFEEIAEDLTSLGAQAVQVASLLHPLRSLRHLMRLLVQQGVDLEAANSCLSTF